MKLFGYYVCHTFVNQLKKLCKTWVVLFIVICMAFGALIGVGASVLGELSEENAPQEEQHQQEPEEELPEEELPEEELTEEEQQENAQLTAELVELAAGGIILAVLVFCALGADKNGSKIFQPADINLLFASPLKPQSVLMFRLATQLGAGIMASVYLLFQIPNLTLNLGLDIWAAIALIGVWCLTIVVGKLLQVLLYTVCSTHITWKKYLRNGIYAFLLLIGVSYYVFLKTSGLDYLDAALAFFNSPASRYIPFWGWLKGMGGFAIAGNLTGVLLSVGGIVAGCLVLGYIIWHVKADFYEDAMAKSQETAQLMEKAQSDKNVIVKRKKDRSDKLQRDGLRHGWGANVFFTKAMYNRFRFAHLRVFTKTSETYLVAAVAVAALCKYVLYTPGLLPVVLTLGALTFFRALGNPLEEDTRLDYFALIPESAWKKLFWSVMGGIANCFLDLLPAIFVSILFLGESLPVALAWIPVIVSVDFFSTTVGTFISLSVPVSAGKMVKQFVQILFVYFGLLPDVGILAYGIVTEQILPAALGATALNLALGFLFLALTPRFVAPKDKNSEKSGGIRQARKRFSIMGFSALLILLVSSVVQILVMTAFPQWLQNSWGMWACTFGPIYLVGVPAGLLLLRAVPAQKPEKHAIKPRQYIFLLLICFCMMYAGNLVGSILTSVLQGILGTSPVNPILNYATHQSVLQKILFLVILAPMIEEFVFRKQLIDRMRPYGEKAAIFTSAVMFGLFHGNLSQLFYAAALGLVFGYVYVKTGKLRYSMGLHMIINFLGGVVGPMFLEHLDFTALGNLGQFDFSALMPMLPWVIAFGLYSLLLFGLAIAGLVILCIYAKKIRLAPGELQLPGSTLWKAVCGNVGMIMLLLACLAMIASTFFAG